MRKGKRRLLHSAKFYDIEIIVAQIKFLVTRHHYEYYRVRQIDIRKELKK